MAIATDYGIWGASILTIAILSYTWKETHFYRWAENTAIGVLGGFLLNSYTDSFLTLSIYPAAEGSLFGIITLILGATIFLSLIPRYEWMRRYGMAVVVGAGLGLSLPPMLYTQILKPISSSMTGVNLESLIYLVMTATGVFYYVFTREMKPGSPMGMMHSVGRYCLLIAFGATFGNFVLSRMSYLLQAIQFILYNWLGLGPAGATV